MPQTYTGLGGTKCTQHDILKATSCSNSLSDTSGWGNQVGAALNCRKNVKWGCAAEHISKPTPPKPIPARPTAQSKKK